MTIEYVTPAEAIDRLMRRHYPGAKKGNPRRVRMALIGALRSGQVDWRCERLREWYYCEHDQTLNQGETSVMPDEGWPCELWQPSLAADRVCWESNCFVSQGTVTTLSASSEVRLWLQSCAEAFATWTRSADGVEIDWSDVDELLGDSGWQVWAASAHHAREMQAQSDHYKEALIRIFALSVAQPSIVWDRPCILERLHAAFDVAGRIPNIKQLEGLTRRLADAIDEEEGEAPVG